MAIAERMKTVTVPAPTVVWEGPEGSGPNGGVTQSLLGRALNCWERFRVYAVEGLQPVRKWNHKIVYGELFHMCEETHAGGRDWRDALEHACEKLCDVHPMHRQEVAKWYNVCCRQFPVYLDYWKSHPEQVSRQSILQEHVFDVPYRLPSGRTVRLRGKWDGVSLMDGGLYLDEHKTKGDVDREQIERNLKFDLQTMLYLVAMYNSTELLEQVAPPTERVAWKGRHAQIIGVRYNVVRRPLSGGKGTIVQKQGTAGTKCQACKGNGFLIHMPGNPICTRCVGKGKVGGTAPETDAEYYARLAQYIKDEPGTYFYRWATDINAADIERFEKKFLRPFLEHLCNWYRYITDKSYDAYSSQFLAGLHWTRPFGVQNYLDEAGFSDYDSYLFAGSTVGLKRVTDLFPELRS